MTDTPTKTKPRPQYGAEKLEGDLPENYSRKSGPRRDPAFIEAVNTAVGDPGEFYCVGTFPSATGAKNKAKEIEERAGTETSLLPDGEWDIEYRTVQGPEDQDGSPKRWSKLYVKYLG